MKKVYSYQEIGHLIDKSQAVVFTRHLKARVTAIQKSRDSQTIHVTFVLLVGEYHVGEFTSEYDTIAELLDVFDIADHEELFELLDDHC